MPHMLDPVNGFTNVTDNSANLFAFIQSLTKGIVQLYKRIDWRISSCKSWLERGNNTIVLINSYTHVYGLFFTLLERDIGL